VEYEWDPTKAALNHRKHRVDFADAVTVFAEPLAITMRDDRHAEDCVVTIGADAQGQLLVVVVVWRGDRIRIISARRPSRLERQQYEA
jgi:uncharacterized protein